MSKNLEVSLVSVEEGDHPLTPLETTPCYYVSFNIPLLNSIIKIEVFKDQIKSYASIIPLAQHLLSLRLKNLSDKYENYTLNEKQLSDLILRN
ncbi:hypothetical protein [Acetobacter oryzifermentans]|uniref:hypothetical protein n=1 Tax=Acetobacter oryzifermentans TaxID=1633874 RepID=UPI000A644CFC|nr:hypothetical protein [Acetobacter oryzifermentans]